ncbi:LacI family DNA-binding transcriptional regulator [Microbacterium sp. BK668]|uniref:LacI family DNA-binding transcriptional regulator n=1 Tax=Microbacterium sp. BK668 TaxID=2512118 RepID=UPI00105EC479|nr:LacI family DNA-binding transcriptional regulator [Microbacterium sp. BK668]TDN91539.1 LacI family transcriptional regulator [Microbacterium sp. BK668]
MPEPRPRRPTINDVAERAGVSKMAVSFALNNRPGVSEETRRRVLDVADELGWRPSSVARSLSERRSGAVGLVLAKSVDALEGDTFYLRLIAGMEAELSVASTALSLLVARDAPHELEIYRTLASERRADAVLIADLRLEDPRLELVRELGLPAVILGDLVDGFNCLWSDDDGATDQVLDHLKALGHRHVARISEAPDRRYAVRRDEAFRTGIAARGMTGVIARGSLTADIQEVATRSLLGDDPRPTAMVFDSELLAVGAMEVLLAAGVDVPREISIVAWDGSTLSRVMHPTLTNVRRDIVALGRAAGKALLAASGGDRADLTSPQTLVDVADPRLVVGGSTAAPR